MINPGDVNLIIFDMDGTIIASRGAVFEAIQRAFAKLGWPVTFREDEINRFFGVSTASTAGSLYEFITPPGSPFSVEEVREKVRGEYPAVFKEMTSAFPGVKETLKALRKRGYKLAQYTNASTAYLNTCMDNLGLREYYDHVECIQDNNLDKIRLAQKIKEKFGGMTAAVVGDRMNDIEAARATDSLSIGALYGYGDDEPKEADITINTFSELLDIFDRRRPIFDRVLAGISRKKDVDKPFVVGISGIDCSGKTFFARGMEEYLNSKGLPTQLVHLDDFLNPREIRYAGEARDELYYQTVKQGYVFNFGRLVKGLLQPARDKGEYTTCFDLRTKDYDIVKEFEIHRDTIVILEGVYLSMDMVTPYIDYRIFLDITFEVCLERARGRDAEDIYEKYQTKYIPAQRQYLAEYHPEKTADLIIDNTNWEYPTIRQTQ